MTPHASSPNAHPDDDAIDPATLPPLESLGPDSDYTVFLQKGVPEALRLAALRRAWMSDPFIRDFRSPAIDYGWDFTTPDYSLRASDDVAKMLDKIFPPKGPALAAPAPLEHAPPSAVELPLADPALNKPRKQAVAPPAGPAPAPAAELAPARPEETSQPRRRHGGALPD